MLWPRLVSLAAPRRPKEVPDERRKEELFREAQRIAHVGYWERDLRTERITLSDEACRIFGLAVREGAITIEEMTERLHPMDRAAWTSAVAQTISGRSSYDLNYRIIRPDGEVRFVRSQADLTKDVSGRPLRLFGAIQDVTDLKRAEHLAQLVFERSPDAICVIGRDYRYQRVNPVYERISDRSAKDLIGMHVAEVLGTTVFEQTVKPKQDRCFEGEEVRYAEWFTYPDIRRYISVSHSPLYSKSDRVEAILSIFHDLTDHAMASEALRSAQAELAHANRVATMGQLTASIAHEVNQPIGAVVMNAQAALRWLDANPPNLQKVRQSLDLIVDDGERAGEVIGRIRGLVKKAPPQRDRVDINNAVLDVIALTRSAILEHGLSLQTDFAADPPLVEGDRIQLQQVILNLMVNAIDAMKSLAENKAELNVSTSIEAFDRVLISVRDTGPGVDPSIMDRLFEAFYTTKPEGMGMGLAICRSIIEAHGGQLWVTANTPRGAVFQFSLPTKRHDLSDEGTSVPVCD